MVIKYKAKYIRDGVVVIDDTELIELGSEDEPESKTEHTGTQNIGKPEKTVPEPADQPTTEGDWRIK